MLSKERTIESINSINVIGMHCNIYIYATNMARVDHLNKKLGNEQFDPDYCLSVRIKIKSA